MAIEIKVPDIGADEVEITEILVKVGDKVEAEQSLITVEGDKASMEVPSPQAGIVKEIKVSVGDKTQTGALIMIFDSADGAADAAPAQAEEKKEAAPAAAPAAAAAKDVNVPDIGSDEVEVTEILVKVGDKVEAEQSLITVEGDKASMEVPAPFAGTVKEIKVNVVLAFLAALVWPFFATPPAKKGPAYGVAAVLAVALAVSFGWMFKSEPLVSATEAVPVKPVAPGEQQKNWAHWGNTTHGDRFAALDQINKHNHNEDAPLENQDRSLPLLSRPDISLLRISNHRYTNNVATNVRLATLPH